MSHRCPCCLQEEHTADTGIYSSLLGEAGGWGWWFLPLGSQVCLLFSSMLFTVLFPQVCMSVFAVQRAPWTQWLLVPYFLFSVLLINLILLGSAFFFLLVRCVGLLLCCFCPLLPSCAYTSARRSFALPLLGSPQQHHAAVLSLHCLVSLRGSSIFHPLQAISLLLLCEQALWVMYKNKPPGQ